jgi:hypothetical protein
MPTTTLPRPPQVVIDTLRDLLNVETPDHQSFRDTIWYLADRWEREKEYERIEDYASPLRHSIPTNQRHRVRVLKMYKRPFGCLLEIDNSAYRFVIKCYRNGHFRAVRHS